MSNCGPLAAQIWIFIMQQSNHFTYIFYFVWHACSKVSKCGSKCKWTKLYKCLLGHTDLVRFRRVLAVGWTRHLTSTCRPTPWCPLPLAVHPHLPAEVVDLVIIFKLQFHCFPASVKLISKANVQSDRIFVYRKDNKSLFNIAFMLWRSNYAFFKKQLLFKMTFFSCKSYSRDVLNIQFCYKTH